MKKLAFGLLIMMLVAACFTPGHSGEPGPAKDSAQGILEFSGTVVYVPLEGGFYGILDPAGKRYDPRNLPEKMRQDGLSVQVKVRPLPNAVGFHMWGTIVEILEISVK